MATYYSQGDGDWSTLTNWDTNSGGGGTDPASVADMDDDAFIVQPGHEIRVDVDMSGFANGIQTLTIQGSSGTPGMVYFYNANGYLKLKTGYNVVGSSGTNKGRLLANSDGVWGNTGAFSSSYTAVIDLQGTAKVDAQYLDIALYCTQPTNTYVKTYGTKYDFTAGAGTVNTTNNTIDLGTTPPAASTKVMITTSGGSLPGGLFEDTIYYVRTVSGNTHKLATTDSDTTIVDITSTGSGTCSIITGHTDTGTATINVLTDLTGDGQWKTTDNWDRVTLVNFYPVATSSATMNQRTQLTTINAGSLVLAANVAAAQAPGSRVYLVSRNVAIRSAGTTQGQAVLDYSNATSASGVFQCEVINTGGTGTTYYGNGIVNGTGHTISGVLSGLYVGVGATTSANLTGLLIGCQTGITTTAATTTVSGTIAGCVIGVNQSSTSGACTVSGSVLSGSTGINGTQTGSTISGTVMGCYTNGFSVGVNTTISGVIKNCATAISAGVTHTMSGEIVACPTALSSCVGHRITGTIHGNTTALSGGTDLLYVGGSLGYTPTGETHANVTDFQLPLSVICRGALLPTSPVYSNRNTTTYPYWGGVLCENCSTSGRSLGASVWYQTFGTITKQTGTVRVGGATSALQVDPLSACSTVNPILIFQWTEDGVAASAQNKSVYIRGFGWSSFPTNTELYVEAEYISNATTFATTITASTAVISDNTTWVQFTIPEFTPAAAGAVRYRGWLKKYASSCGVYVDAQLN